MHAAADTVADAETEIEIDLDINLADTVPVLPLEAAIVQEMTRFDAPAGCGVLSLQIDGAPAANATVAALLLDRCDALLDALDAWLHTALDWRWVDAAPAGAALGACASAHGTIEADDSPALAWRLEVPWELLRDLGAPPPALAQRLQWNDGPAVVVVSRPMIDDAELRLIERGGAIVLPESMRAPWHGLLHAPREGAGHGLVVELPTADSVRLGGTPAPAREPAEAAGRPFCEVRMAPTRPLSPAHLAGWAEGSTLELAPRASLWRCAGPDGADRYLAGGRLLPWGDGWAMLIEAV